MAKKKSSKLSPRLFSGIRSPSSSTAARPLFFAGPDRRSRRAGQYGTPEEAGPSHEVFRKWIQDLKAGVLDAQTETQVEQDFYKILLAGLGYTTSADVETGRPWTMQTKWSEAGADKADSTLGRFHLGESRTLVGNPLVVVEVKGALKDLDRKDSSVGVRCSKPGIIRFPVISCAPSDIWSIAHSLDRFRVFGDRTQTPHGFLLQLVVIPIRTVGPVMRTQVMPEILHRIQFRRVRRQLDQAHIAGHHQIRTGVEACPVPDQYRMHPGGQLPRELLQELVHDRGVQGGHDQRRHRPRGRTHGRQHVQRAESRLPHRTRSRTPPRPDPGDRPLLAEAGFILEIGTEPPAPDAPRRWPRSARRQSP